MRRMSLSSLTVLSLLSLSTPALADAPTQEGTGVAVFTARLVAQAQETPPAIIERLQAWASAQRALPKSGLGKALCTCATGGRG